MKARFLDEDNFLFEMAFKKISGKSVATPNGVELNAYEDTNHKEAGPFVNIHEVRYKLKKNENSMPKVGEVWFMYFPIKENKAYGLVHPGIVVKSELNEITFLAIMVTDPPRNKDGSIKLRNSGGKLMKSTDNYQDGDDVPVLFGPSSLLGIFHPNSLIRISSLSKIETSQLISKMGELNPREKDFDFIARIVKKAYPNINMKKLILQ